jgi:N-acetylglucosaminyldiphosphoundecaprenol N-acetyl-beta-D-mannosaminyltransferase
MCSIRKTVTILGVKIDVLTPPELIERIDLLLEDNTKSTVFYVNPDCLNKAYVDGNYRKILNSASLVYADGVGVVIAGWLTRQYLPCRITAIDIFHQLCDMWQNKGIRLYFLGASEQNIEKATTNLKAAHPNLMIAGYHHGYFKSDSEELEIIHDIDSKSPDILLVGLGAPLQEEWVHGNLNNLNTRVCWCVGGLFDLLSGNLKRGPKFLHQNNFEWLCRLLITPKKVWKRYLIGNPQFLIRVLISRHGRWEYGEWSR